MTGPDNDDAQRLRLLLDLLEPERRTSVVDVGASPLEEPPYRFLLKNGACDVWGFEPQPAEYEKLRARASQREHYLPYAIGDGGRMRLNLTRHPGFTSALEPNRAVSRGLNRWHRDLEILQTIWTETRRLDDIEEITNIDLLKIDIQGGETAAIRNGARKLGASVAIITEVSAIPIYVDQPLLGDQMRLLAELGFSLHKFDFFRKVPFRTKLSAKLPKTAIADQLTDGDAIFVKNLFGLVDQDNERLKHLCILADFVFHSYSLALKAVEILLSRGALPMPGATVYAEAVSAAIARRI